MAAGSLVKPEQFSVVDDHTFKATFDQFNKLTMPDLVVPVPVIVNSELAKKHATRRGPVGVRMGVAQRLRRRRLQGGVLDARPADRVHPVRRLEVRPVAPS